MPIRDSDPTEYLPMVEEEMRRAVSPPNGRPPEFYASMQYAMGWLDEELRPTEAPGGKRLRPRLCLLACAASRGDPHRAVQAAAAIELLHNFTLVHDDIQDSSPQRHHRPSVWSLTGVPLAINTGDGMLIASHLLLTGLARSEVPPALVVHAVEQFDRTALRVCEGQHMDISFEARDSVSSAEYLEMIQRKTAALMGLSCYLGALVGATEVKTLEMYRTFGERLGMGYQIRDDLAGVWQEETRTGKRAMEDIYQRKKSYPVVRAFEAATGEDAVRLRSIYTAEVSEADALWVRDLMDRLGLQAEGRARIQECARSAVEALDASGASGPAADELRRIADWLLE